MPGNPGHQASTPEAFLLRGAPTFVLGTAGDARADRAITTQVDLLRGFLAAPGSVVDDGSFDPADGASAWPDNPVLYGGPHVHRTLQAIEATLPFELGPGRLALGEQVFEGEEIQFVAVVAARAADDEGPGYREFLLYAGTATPGIGEINAQSRGTETILVADAFGPLVTGQWTADGEGEVTADLAPPARRIDWRAVERPLGAAGQLRVLFPQQLAAAPDEDDVVEAVVRGSERVLERLDIADPVPLAVYVYPDLRSKESLTRGGDGHAVVGAHALHVVTGDPSPGSALENLIAHEATHVLGDEGWGPAASPLLAEGLAVWVAGQYGGVALEDWLPQLPDPQPIASLLPGRAFREVAEQETYPLAGLLVDVAIAEVGAAGVREHLLGATAETWDDACRRAGTTAAALDAALQARLASSG